MRLSAALFFAAVFPAAAQSPQVPHKMEFAGITLTIRDDARREIQKDVDALTLSPRHFNMKVERARTYFPIIEKIFREEQVPEDFKYLALQESALTPDAVSSSHAVGFWQFKDFTAIEMGLRVDKQVDERMNIVSSSRAAARYIKKNNTFFDNWVYALQAYQMGAGGVLRSVNDTRGGARHMEINSGTYWYVKKYLAHKIAYEPSVQGKPLAEVYAYENSKSKSLSDLAKEVQVDENELRTFNKWAKSGDIPGDKTYVVLIPLAGNRSAVLESLAVNEKIAPAAEAKVPLPERAPLMKKKINGVYAVRAQAGEDAVSLASRAGVDLADFLRYNDLSIHKTALEDGSYYFLSKKRVRAVENFHKVQPGESLWSISQQYGVQLKRLRKYNRLAGDEEAEAGAMLWLASARPKSGRLQKPVENPVAVNEGDSFNWTASPATNVVAQTRDTIETSGASVIPPVREDTTRASGSRGEAMPDIPEPVLPQPVLAEAQSVDTVQAERIPVVIQQPIAEPRKTTHIVQSKETLYGIAKLYNVSVMNLVDWNKLNLQQGIRTGQVLKVSENQEIASETRVSSSRNVSPAVHEVKASDTLYSIARQYGVTIKEIMDWNEKKDFSLAVGEKLKIHPAR